MKNITNSFSKYQFFLILFILMSILKTPYIAIISEYFNLVSTPIAYWVRISIIILGILIIFYKKKFFIHKIYLCIITIFLLLFFVILSQLVADTSLNLPKDNIYYLGFAFSIIAFVSVTFFLFKDIDDISNSLFYLLCFFSLISLLLGSDEGHNRLQLASLDPISTGYFGGMLVLISLWRLFFLTNNKIISFIGFIIGFILLIAANSRSPMLGVIIGSMFMLFNKKKNYYFVFFLLLIVFLLIYFIYFESEIDLRVFVLPDIETDLRIQIYKYYLSEILNNLILPSVPPVFHFSMAHNIFFGVYSGTSIFGLLIFLYLVYFTLVASYKLIRYNTAYGWVSLLFILSLSKSMVSGAILSESFWIFLSLVNIYYFKINQRNKKNA